ncbi:MAG: DUF4810 domain-containing protein [Marinilabiliaceae bacterium]|nr:DUF4810 domain-containing protein [Bacteroidales bacterium]MDY4521039.1 DUF4810 domain-containing protein [Bacteroidales bacterium]
MKKRLIIACAAAVMSLAFTSCKPKQVYLPLYIWHDYNDASYAYSKVPSEETLAALMKVYEDMMNDQEGSLRQVPPPGMLAEYGYMLCKAGQKEKGLELLKKEIKVYPESEVFVSRIIKQLEK